MRGARLIARSLDPGAGIDFFRLGEKLFGHKPEPCRSAEIKALARPDQEGLCLMAQIIGGHGTQNSRPETIVQ